MDAKNVTVGSEVIVYVAGRAKHYTVGTVERILKNGLVVAAEGRSIRFAACGVEVAPKTGLGCTVELEWKSGNAAEAVESLNEKLEAQAERIARLEKKWALEG